MTRPKPNPNARKNVWIQAEVSATHLRGRFWRIDRPLIYIDGRGREWIIPAGFVTDFASVPWPFTLFIPRSGDHNSAAVLHDFLYVTMALTRRECDVIFISAMSALGVFAPKAGTMYLAVRVGGWFPWMKRTWGILPDHDRPFADYYAQKENH
jgi:hypothetical protein